MYFGLRFIFVVLCCATILIFSVYLRNAEDRIFYQLCKLTTLQSRTKQSIWQKQLKLESRMNPGEVSKLFEDDQE